jgi:3-hydroxybutyrate dehydrogenase
MLQRNIAPTTAEYKIKFPEMTLPNEKRILVLQGGGALGAYQAGAYEALTALKSAYVTAKHGLIGLSKVIAKEGAEHGVRSNVICPGFVKTPLIEKQIPEQTKTLGISEDEIVKRIMLGGTVDHEFTTVEDVAEVALLFAAFPTNALTVSLGWFME